MCSSSLPERVEKWHSSTGRPSFTGLSPFFPHKFTLLFPRFGTHLPLTFYPPLLSTPHRALLLGPFLPTQDVFLTSPATLSSPVFFPGPPLSSVSFQFSDFPSTRQAPSLPGTPPSPVDPEPFFFPPSSFASPDSGTVHPVPDDPIYIGVFFFFFFPVVFSSLTGSKDFIRSAPF